MDTQTTRKSAREASLGEYRIPDEPFVCGTAQRNRDIRSGLSKRYSDFIKMTDRLR